MHMIDFSYDGKRLSDYECIVASVVTSNEDSISLGSNITFETLRNPSTFINKIIKTDYADPISVTFDVCKNPCSNSKIFTDTEISFMMRWLNTKSYKIFKPVYDDGFYPNIYFKGSFNATAIYIGGDVVGLTLTFTANSPFGYDDEENLEFQINNSYDSFIFYDNSDEYGYLYPTQFIITCKSDGDFIMTNNIDTNIVKINNCVSDEIITLDCCNKVIQSNKEHSTLYNDFNYKYPRFVVNENTNQNMFTVSLPCEIKIIYSLIRKAGIVV